MRLYWKKLGKVGMSRRLLYLTCFCFLVVLIVLSLLNSKLPELPLGLNHFEISNGVVNHGSKQGDIHRLGSIAETMVSMLPDNLAFTIFIPSEEAFAHILNLTADDLAPNKWNDTVAVLSRVVGFSTVPKHLPSTTVERKVTVCDSVSGYRLYVWKDDSSGRLVVNDIWSEQNDVWIGEIIVHIVSGVIMDAEFGRAFGLETAG